MGTKVCTREKTHTHGSGYKISWVQVQVQLKIPISYPHHSLGARGIILSALGAIGAHSACLMGPDDAGGNPKAGRLATPHG